MTDLLERLSLFAKKYHFVRQKGPLCIALVVTDHARKRGLPLDPEKLLTNAGTQVLGTGGPAVERILSALGESRKLAAEGGRTSRGSVNNMRAYVGFLNEVHEQGIVDFDVIDQFWLIQVQLFFAGKPFRIQMDFTKGIRAVIQDLIRQAQARQKESSGTQYVGALLQHLVGAMLACALGNGCVAHNSFSTSDEQSGRFGDFEIEDVIVHVTSSPSEALIRRCAQNLGGGRRPLIITLAKGLLAAEQLAENAKIEGRIDIFEIEQLIAMNLYELGKFKADRRIMAIADLVTCYNEIIEEIETDPSLKIEIKS
jgi:hypothetical protein